jgi:hydroxyquinol 1,2-dioxygenase
MRNVTVDNLTEVFAAYFGKDTDPRTREVLVALARHIHDFAREVNLTHDEWRKGLAMLEHAGRITTPESNEFVLFSDVLGLSSLVDMMHSNPAATSSSVLGPFHVSNPRLLEMGGYMRRDYGGTALLVEGQVRGTIGEVIPHAKIDIWQTAPNGMYFSQDPDQDIHSFHGLMTADETGHFRFTTVRPVEYTVPSDGPVGELLDAAGRHPWRPSHLYYIVTALGYRTLVTEIFPDDYPYLDQDTVFGVRDDLVMTYHKKPSSDFPDGMALSGKVSEPFLHLKFDVILSLA